MEKFFKGKRGTTANMNTMKIEKRLKISAERSKNEVFVTEYLLFCMALVSEPVNATNPKIL